MTERSIVGLIGFARAGKSEAARYLAECYGFHTVKRSDRIRRALLARYGETEFSREQYRAMYLELKPLESPTSYIDDALVDQSRILVDGARHLSTARDIEARGGFLIGIVARDDVRYARAQSASDGKPVPANLDDFRRDEAPDLNSLRPGGGQLLPILRQISPERIIDTSEMNLGQAYAALDAILNERGIGSRN